jgi:hypothetical protein
MPKILQILGIFLEKGNKLEMHSEILPALPTKTFWLFLGYKSRGKEVRVYCEVVIAQEGRIASYNFYNDDFLFIFGTTYLVFTNTLKMSRGIRNLFIHWQSFLDCKFFADVKRESKIGCAIKKT